MLMSISGSLECPVYSVQTCEPGHRLTFPVARAMRCLNITPLCAETSQAKGRVERAHLTLQDRLVKELRLKGISTIEGANTFAEEYMADYNRRFAKAPRHDFNAHRPLALSDDLDAEFTFREPRRVSKSLTVQYDKMLYLIEPSINVPLKRIATVELSVILLPSPSLSTM